MPSKDEHIGNLRHNYAFLKECETKCDAKTTYPDWLFIVRFYVCVHIVEAILATKGIHSERHADRSTKISRLKDLFRDDFEIHYRDLLNASYLARYTTKIRKNMKPDILQDNEKSFNYIVNYAKDKFGITVDEPISTPTS